MSEKIYPKGIRVFKPREGAPDWVLGQVIVTPVELVEWVQENLQHTSEYQGKKQIKLDLLKGKDGPYVAVNTYKPAPSQPVNKAFNDMMEDKPDSDPF